MSYKQFSTGNADYWLLMGNHFTLANEPIIDRGNIQSLDAIVLEDGGISTTVLVDYDPQFRNVTRMALESKIPVFTLDIPANVDVGKYYYAEEITKYAGLAGAILASASFALLAHKNKLTRRRVIGLLGFGIISVATIAAGFAPKNSLDSLGEQRKEASEFDMSIIETETELVRTEIVTLRNAVNARKIEEYLSPMLKQRIGKKPKIAMIYGQYHAGLRNMILDREKRDEVIEYYSAVLNEKNTNSTFEKMLNNIYEFNSDETGNGFVGTEYDTSLF